jgi:AAA+ ATPase superfamily predicted ATPase
MKVKNPFLTAGYEGPETFCDRERETAELIASIENGRNTTLIAPRRYGKTGLIKNTLSMLPSEYDKVYIDIYATECLSDFVKLFAEECVASLETTREKIITSLGRFFGSLRPTVSPQNDGSVKWSLDIAENMAKDSLSATFDFLRERDRPVVIAIDEFQQVRNYPEGRVEALIRSYIQFLPNVRFIFAGSAMHMMSEMFVTPRGAFYNSTDILALDVIDKNIYLSFAGKFFKEDGLEFSDEAFRYLYDRFSGVTWYIQAVLNRIWQTGNGLTLNKDVDSAVDTLIGNCNLVFMDLFRSQSDASKAMLKAVAKNCCVSTPTGKEFLRANSLGAASTVASVVANLLQKELLYKTVDGIIVYDKLFAEWLKRMA